jgi:hypothetical protein
MNSASYLNSFATPLPSCDAWLTAQLNGTSVVVGGSAGISSFTRVDAGNFRASFSDPRRFSSGEYVSIFTPEVKADTGYFAISCNSNGTTAPGISASQGGIRSWIFQTPVTNSGHTASNVDPPTGQMFINMAVFCFSTDSRLYSPTGSTYSFVPGQGGFGVSGATYNTHHHTSNSRRKASAYGTIVIPPNRTNSSRISPYIENSYNVKSVTAVNGGPVYDVQFLKPLNTSSYAVILSSEMEDIETSAGVANPVEFCLNIIRRGSSDQHKTNSKFRIEQFRQDVNNQWYASFIPMQLGKTHRIHFMVFGGETYGAE